METLQQQRWYRKLCCFQKILNSQSPKYLYSVVPIHNMSYRTRQCNKIPAINAKHAFFKNTFFPSTIIEWNKLDWKIKNSESIETFKKRTLSFVRRSPNNTYNCHNPKEIKLLSRPRLGLGHHREHKFKQVLSTHFAVVEKVKLKLVLMIFSTVPTIKRNDWPS